MLVNSCDQLPTSQHSQDFKSVKSFLEMDEMASVFEKLSTIVGWGHMRLQYI